MKRHPLLLLLSLIIPLTSIGQKSPQTLRDSFPAYQVNWEVSIDAPPSSDHTLLEMPMAFYLEDSSKLEPLKKMKAKDFPKPKVSKNTSKRKARRAKTSY